MPSPDVQLLIVEDNDLDVFMAERLLKRLQLKVSVIRAKNGEEALELLRPEGTDAVLTPPFVMLLDINMPRMSGFELLEELTGDDILKQIPIYIISTSSRQQDKDKARSYGVTAYLEKPLTEKNMLDIFNRPPDAAETDEPTDP